MTTGFTARLKGEQEISFLRSVLNPLLNQGKLNVRFP
jgi:hypothetical protein